MKLKHYTIFHNKIKSLKTPEDWDVIRTSIKEKHFNIPKLAPDLTNTLNPIGDYLIDKAKYLSVKTIYSIGSGTASLELYLKLKSQLSVIVSDFTDSVINLKSYNIFDDCIKLDVLREKISLSDDESILMSRLDTEFTDEQLEKIFSNFSDSNVRNVFFIPTQFLSFYTFITEVKVLLISILKRKRRTFCGYYRSKSEFDKILSKYYSVELFYVGYKPVYILTQKK